MKAATWAAIAAGAAVVGGLGAGAALRVHHAREARAALKKIIPWLEEPATSYRPKLPKLGPMPPGVRLEAALVTWMALLDAIVKGYGDYWGAIVNVRKATEPGGLLFTVSDAWNLSYASKALTSATAKTLWDDGQSQKLIAQADARLKAAVELGAHLERERGALVTPDGTTVSLLDVAEQYVAEAAIGYLASVIPGAGAVLALAQQAGVDWDNTSGRQVVTSAQLRDEEWAPERKIAWSRALDLIRHAKAAG